MQNSGAIYIETVRKTNGRAGEDLLVVGSGTGMGWSERVLWSLNTVHWRGHICGERARARTQVAGLYAWRQLIAGSIAL